MVYLIFTDVIFAVIQFSEKQEEENGCEEFQIRYISLKDNGMALILKPFMKMQSMTIYSFVRK